VIEVTPTVEGVASIEMVELLRVEKVTVPVADERKIAELLAPFRDTIPLEGAGAPPEPASA
jgi:hypothetical protein